MLSEGTPAGHASSLFGLLGILKKASA
jgi:hypothetical protein